MSAFPARSRLQIVLVRRTRKRMLVNGGRTIGERMNVDSSLFPNFDELLEEYFLREWLACLKPRGPVLSLDVLQVDSFEVSVKRLVCVGELIILLFICRVPSLHPAMRLYDVDECVFEPVQELALVVI